AEDGIRDFHVTGVQTCALPISHEDDGLAIDTAANGGGVGERVHRNAGREIGAIGALRLCTHDALLSPPRWLELARAFWNISTHQIGRASCRERVYIIVGGVAVK